MATFTVKFREGADLLVEGAFLSSTQKEGSHVPVILVHRQDRSTVAVIPADAVKAVYMTDAAK